MPRLQPGSFSTRTARVLRPALATTWGGWTGLRECVVKLARARRDRARTTEDSRRDRARTPEDAYLPGSHSARISGSQEDLGSQDYTRTRIQGPPAPENALLGSSVGVRGWAVSRESQSSYPSYFVCGELPRVCAPTWRSLSGPSDSSKPVYPPTDRGLPGALGCFSLVREFAPRGDPRETKLFFPLLVTVGNCKREKKCRKVCFPAGAHLVGWGVFHPLQALEMRTTCTWIILLYCVLFYMPH